MNIRSTYDQALLAAKQGNKLHARAILREILKREPYNEEAWLLFSKVAQKKEHVIYSLEKVLKINPNNQAARTQLESTRGKPRKTTFTILATFGVLFVACSCLILLMAAIGNVAYNKPPSGLSQPTSTTGIGITRAAIQSVFEDTLGFRVTKTSYEVRDGPCITMKSPNGRSDIELCGPPENLNSAQIKVDIFNNAPNEVNANLNSYMYKFLELATPEWKEGTSWLNSNISTGRYTVTAYKNLKISLGAIEASDGKMRVLTVDVAK